MKLFVTLARTIPSAVCALALAASGCSNEAPAPAAQGSVESKGADSHEHSHGGGHDHGSTGPHDGQVVELGNEDYHAELVHDEKAGMVTIYLLDGTAKNAVAIDAAELTINVKQSGKGRQFKLAAAPQEGDTAGKSSRFSSDDKELNEALDQEDATARLVVEVDGKSYTGRLEHHHDHEGHDHKH